MNACYDGVQSHYHSVETPSEYGFFHLSSDLCDDESLPTLSSSVGTIESKIDVRAIPLKRFLMHKAHARQHNISTYRRGTKTKYARPHSTNSIMENFFS
uniref:Uncharacterized protein n=1 Tax=Cucumis melo TaxID=3656 RepID=A0A9I9EE66_CUCME